MNKQDNKKITRARRKELLKRLDTYVTPNKQLLYKIAGLSYVQFLARIISFAMIAWVFDKLYHRQPIDLLSFGLGVLGWNIIGFLAAQVAKKYQGIVSQQARNQMKAEFFNAFQTQPLQEKTTADVLTIATQGIDTLDTYFGLYLNQTLRAYLNCASVLAIVAILFPMGSIIFLVSLPFIPVSIVLIQKRSRQIMQQYWATYMDVGNLFMDDLSGLNTLYTYQADEAYASDFAQKAEQFRQSTMQLLMFQLQSVGYMDAVMYVGVALSGFMASLSFIQGQISLFTVVFFVLIASEFFMPIREAGYGMHLVMMNTKMADRLFRFLDSVASDDEPAEQLMQSIKTLNMSKLSYGFNGKSLVSNLSLQLKAGESLAICGVSGRGKSTLAKILQKQVPFADGDIFINGKPIQQFSKQALAKEIAYVSPDNYLFLGTIYDNLALATDLSPVQLIEWLQQEELLTFVNDLPDGLQTPVGENGSLLSPGQRQQVLLTRALLGDFSLYIFDEMTSSVDRETEQVIMSIIQKIAQKRTVLFISHKMKHVIEMDRVLFMGEQCIKIDKPAHLLEHCAEFKTLYHTQQELEVIWNEV